jgi:hypothetical protein
MPRDWAYSPLRKQPEFSIKPKQLARGMAHRIFAQWAGGMAYTEIADRRGMTADGVKIVIKNHISELWRVYHKWKMAETKCHALSMELRLLRAGKDCPEDQPIEAIKPPKIWLKAFRQAGIGTVNQLRAVSTDVLLSQYRFPEGAIDWAILKMDKLGLTYALQKSGRRAALTKLPRRSQSPPCTLCGSTNTHKNGHHFSGGWQRYRCEDCRKEFQV